MAKKSSERVAGPKEPDIENITPMAYASVMSDALHSVIETPEFVKAAKRAGIEDEERAGIIDHFARNPDDGTALGGGLFKARIARPGGGKSGGYRTIHFFRGADIPVVMLTVYAKNRKDTLSPAQEAAYREVADMLAKELRARNERR